MRPLSRLCVALCVFLLTACGGPRPIPEWAMNPQSGYATKTVERHARTASPARRRIDLAEKPSDDQMQSRRTSMSPERGRLAQSTYRANEPAPFTKEWYEREEGIDAQLRRRMRICASCWVAP